MARAGHARWMTSRASTGPRAGRCGFRAHMYTCDVHTQYANTAGANWRDPLLRLLLIRVLRCAIRSFYYDRGRSRAQLQSRNGDVSRGPATRTTTYRYRDWDSEAHARSRLVSYRTGRAESFVLADDAITFCAHANARRRIALGWRGRPWEDQVKGEGTVRVGGWESAKTPGSAPAPDSPRLLFVLPHFARGRSPGEHRQLASADEGVAHTLIQVCAVCAGVAMLGHRRLIGG